MAKVRIVLAAVVVSAATAVAWGQSTSVEEPIVVQPGVAQLFVDDGIIDGQTDVKRTLHQPKKDFDGHRPIIQATPGSGLLAYGSIVYDEELGQYVAFPRAHKSTTYYRATSTDGLHWNAERQEQLTAIRFDRGDIQPEPDARGNLGLDLFSCYYDAKNKDYPYQGWLYFANYGKDREGIYYVRSRDGIAWERGPMIVNAYAGPGDTSSRTITQDGKTVYGPGDVTLFYHDPVTDRFLGIFKFYTAKETADKNGLRSRAYMFLDRLDESVDTSKIERIALLPQAANRDGDTAYDEYYASTAWRYESLWLGGLKVYHQKGDYPFSSAGCAFLKLVVSRDGLNWKKVPFDNDAGVPEVFIPNGPEGGYDSQDDGGYISEFSQGPLRIGDELIYYYCCTSYGKNHERGKRVTGGGMFRARLRVDGFVSVDDGSLMTKPFAFEGNDLTINGIGPIAVEVQTIDGKKLADAMISGDSIRHTVTFDGKTLRQIAKEGRARLCFHVRPGGQMYSFTVK